MALDDLVDVPDIGLEAAEIIAPVIGQRDLGEDRDRVAQLPQIDVGAVAGDVARLLEPLEPHQAWARRETDGLGEIDVRDPAVLLQMRQYPQIYPVQLRKVVHRVSACPDMAAVLVLGFSQPAAASAAI